MSDLVLIHHIHQGWYQSHTTHEGTVRTIWSKNKLGGTAMTKGQAEELFAFANYPRDDVAIEKLTQSLWPEGMKEEFAKIAEDAKKKQRDNILLAYAQLPVTKYRYEILSHDHPSILGDEVTEALNNGATLAGPLILNAPFLLQPILWTEKA